MVHTFTACWSEAGEDVTSRMKLLENDLHAGSEWAEH